MEIELSKKTIDAIAHKVMVMLYQRLSEGKDEVPEMVTCKEAAAILHISPVRLRQRKDEFPHIKNGDNKQGKLLFVRKALLEEYSK